MEVEVRARSGWGEYHSYILDALSICIDYASRLERSIAGEIAPDRHYFLEKADALQRSATILVERCEEVEHWIGADARVDDD